MIKDKQKLKNNLLKSFKKESESIDERFAKANSIILNKTSYKNKAAGNGVIKCTFTIHPEVIKNIDKTIINAAKIGYIVNKSEIVRLAINNLYELSRTDSDLFNEIVKIYK